jgi:hypothetical protein
LSADFPTCYSLLPTCLPNECPNLVHFALHFIQGPPYPFRKGEKPTGNPKTFKGSAKPLQENVFPYRKSQNLTGNPKSLKENGKVGRKLRLSKGIEKSCKL